MSAAFARLAGVLALTLLAACRPGDKPLDKPADKPMPAPQAQVA